MRVLVQRVENASVTVDGQTVARIGRGLLLLVGIGQKDSADDVAFLSRKVGNLRVFNDAGGRMNLNIMQAEGEVMSVPQFTLYANLRRGNRPGFEESAEPERARALWSIFNDALRKTGVPVQEGVFGAHMSVSLVNDGPVTILLESK